jgi:hypothetical protein
MKTLLFCVGGAAVGVVLGGFNGATSAEEPAYAGRDLLAGMIIGGVAGLVIGLVIALLVGRTRS